MYFNLFLKSLFVVVLASCLVVGSVACFEGGDGKDANAVEDGDGDGEDIIDRGGAGGADGDSVMGDNPPVIRNFEVSVDVSGNLKFAADVEDDVEVKTVIPLIGAGARESQDDPGKYYLSTMGTVTDVNMKSAAVETFPKTTFLQVSNVSTQEHYSGTNFVTGAGRCEIDGICTKNGTQEDCILVVEALGGGHLSFDIVDAEGNSMTGLYFFTVKRYYTTDLSDPGSLLFEENGTVPLYYLDVSESAFPNGARLWGGIEVEDSAGQVTVEGKEFDYSY